MWKYTVDAARSAPTTEKITQPRLSSALYLYVYKFYRAFHRSVRGKLSTFKLPALSLSQVLYQKNLKTKTK